MTTAARAARRLKPETPPSQHRSVSEFDDSAIGMPMNPSPENVNNVQGPISSHLLAYPFTNALQPQPQQPQRHPSISSQGSLIVNGMQSSGMSMAQTMSIPPPYNYSSAYTTAQSSSPSYMPTSYNVPSNHYAPYSQPMNSQSQSRNYEPISVSRSSPHAAPALPPPSSLLSNSRSQLPISTSY